MATLYSTQYNQAYVAVPSSKIAPGDSNSSIMFKYFEYTFTAAPATNDIIKLFKLPKNTRVLDFEMSFPDLGTTGVLDVGWAASAELTVGTTTPVEAADADGFLVDVDVNTAAAIVNMADVTGAAVPGYLKEFGAEVDVQIDVNTTWTVASGTIKGYIKYVNA